MLIWEIIFLSTNVSPKIINIYNILYSASICKSLQLIRGNIHGLVLKWLNIFFLIYCVGGAHAGLKFKFSSFFDVRKSPSQQCCFSLGGFLCGLLWHANQ